MAEKMERQQVAELAIIHAEPQFAGTVVDRSFELPTVLYGATVACFLAYLVTMGFGFAHPEMILPMAIFTFFVIAGFGIPALWTRMKPDNPRQAMSWDRFLHVGIQTETGRLEAKAATIQVLILPVLIMAWGIAVVTIAAIVR